MKRIWRHAFIALGAAIPAAVGTADIVGRPSIIFYNHPEQQEKFARYLSSCVSEKISQHTDISFDHFQFQRNYKDWNPLSWISSSRDDDYIAATYTVKIDQATTDTPIMEQIKKGRWALSPGDSSARMENAPVIFYGESNQYYGLKRALEACSRNYIIDPTTRIKDFFGTLVMRPFPQPRNLQLAAGNPAP